jgi:ribosomal protein L37E
VAEDLGLNRNGFERLARAHALNSVWALDHVSMALVYHMADAVFEDATRHLWSDNSGKRHGALHVTPFHEFSTIHGRARSHTTENKWETFRLYGSLEGHLDAYGHGALGAHPTLSDVAALSAGTPILRQCKRVTTTGPTKWSRYAGPLVMVFAGGPQSKEPELQLPLLLPQGRGRWDRVVHYLSQPDPWHKIDLVRRADSSQSGGWRYEMHLLVLSEGYVAPRNRELLDAAPTDRKACVDVNVSNLTMVSVGSRHLDPRSTMVRVDANERDRLARAEAKKRRELRRVDRSRRASNAAQYAKSKAQVKRDERRAFRGLRPVTDATPRGGRLSNANGVPRQAYRRDQLSSTYRDLRRRQGEQARAGSLTKQTKAHDVAVQLVATHGTNWFIEDCNLTAWAKLWGKSLHAFAPGMVTAELAALVVSRGGSFTKVATGPTALSSHCLCGRRAKKDLSTRTHVCTACGFVANRDLVSAALGTCVVCTDLSDPRSARVNYTKAAALLAALSSPTLYRTTMNTGHQDALTSQTHSLVCRVEVTRHNKASGQRDTLVGLLVSTPRTAQSTNGLSSLSPAKVAHGPALGCISPPGDLRLSS